MQKLALMLLGVVLVLSSIFPALTCPADRSQHNPAVTESLPAYDGGYGYDSVTATMYDHNGFAYSYLPDGIIKLTLPWGYVTYFSFGLTGSYLGVPQKVSALDYTWTWDAQVEERSNDTGVSQGYDYTFTATNAETLDWTIELEFSPIVGEHMKVTHTVVNGYPNALTGVEFWYLFDLTHTPDPCVTTNLGTYYPPLYSVLPDSVTWLRLSNQFQFDWRDADFANGHAYLGDGSVVGVDVDILGVSLVLGDILPGGSRTIDPYFSGVTRTWAALTNSDSNTASNWSPAGVPATGDNITFDATSVFNCNWNTAVTVGNFSMLTGYSGIVTQANNFGVTSFLIGAGTYTGSLTKTLTDSGHFTRVVGGTITPITTILSMTGNGTITFSSTSILYALYVTNANTVTIAFTAGVLVSASVINIGADATIIIANGATLRWYDTGAQLSFGNLGEITGVGTGLFRHDVHESRLVSYGIIDAPVTLLNRIAATRTITLGSALTVGVFSITNAEATGYMTVTTIYDMTTLGVTVSTRGTLDAYASAIIVGGAWTSSAGTFTPGTSTVTLSGAGSTVTTGTGQTFYNLIVSGTYTTASSVNVTHNLTVSGGLTLGAGKTLDWNTTDGEYSNTGTIAGTGTLALTMQDDYSLTLGTVTCPTIVRKAVGSTGAHTVALAVDTELAGDFAVESGIDLDPNDKVVTVVDDLELDLPSPSSLWNVTVEAGVTVTLTVDVIVELRATVLGTVAGADFLEPEPAFTSVPDLTASPLETYEYAITQAYWDALSVVEAPAWLSYLDGSLVGVPAESDVGLSNVSLLLSWNDMTTYQNYTVYVAYTPMVDMPWFTTTMSLVLSLVLGFGCLILGLVFQMHYLTFFSGLIWLFSALGVYSDINIGWTVLSIALGMMLMMFGGAKIAGE